MAHRPAILVATYLCGFLSLSLLQMVALATPLWSGHLGLSAAMLGFAAGARSIAPLALSIHFGALIDQVGVRRLMIIFALQCALLPLLYPAMPHAWAFITLQVFLGLAAATVWLAAQTAIARVGRDMPAATRRFSACTGAGTVVGPLLLGIVWDGGGPWAGYAVMSVWGTALLITGFLLPRRAVAQRPKLSLGAFVPRLQSYRDALTALRKPLAAFVIACTFLRLGNVSMLESFYPALLQGIGFSTTAIGFLFAVGNLASAPSSLATGLWVRAFGSQRRALIGAVSLSVVAIAATPLFVDFWALCLAIAVYGFGLGVSMPLIFELLSQGGPAGQQGVVAGLRATANRLAAFLLPVAMGVIAEFAGVSSAFAVVGVLLLGALASVDHAFRHRVK